MDARLNVHTSAEGESDTVTERFQELRGSKVGKQAVPREIWIGCLSKFGATNLIKLSRISQWWSRIASSDSLWRRLCDLDCFHEDMLCQPPVGRESSTSTASGTANGFYKLRHVAGVRNIENIDPHRIAVKEVPVDVDVNSIWCLAHTLQYIFLGYVDGRIDVWTTSSLKLLVTLTGHTDKVRCLAADLRFAVSVSDDMIRIWDIKHFTCSHVLTEPQQYQRSLRLRHDLFVIGSWVGKVTIWNVRSGRKRAVLEHGKAVLSVDFNDSILLSGSEDGTLKIWNSASHQLIGTYENHTHDIWKVQVCGDYIISSGEDKRVHLRSAVTFESIAVFPNRSHETVYLNKHLLVTSPERDALSVYNLKLKTTQSFKDHWICPGPTWVVGKYILRMEKEHILIITLSKDLRCFSMTARSVCKRGRWHSLINNNELVFFGVDEERQSHIYQINFDH